jgi:hypothetical protein
VLFVKNLLKALKLGMAIFIHPFLNKLLIATLKMFFLEDVP